MTHLSSWYLRSALNTAVWLLISILTTTAIPGFLSAQDQLTQPLHLPDKRFKEAKLTGIQGKQLEFSVAKSTGNQTIATQQVVRWGSWRGIIGSQAVWMSDGSWLSGQVQLSNRNQLRLQSKWLNLPELPFRSIRAVVYTPVASLADWIAMEQMLKSLSGENDVVWLRDRKQLTGVIELDSLTEDAKELSIKVADQKVSVPLEEIAALAFSPSLFSEVNAEPALQIGIDDGSLLRAVEFSIADGKANFVLPSLAKVASLDDTSEFVRAVTLVQNSPIAKLQRMDQLKPASYRHISDSTLEFSLGVNEDVYGKPLVQGSQRHAGIVFHGLALHGASQVAYRWDRSPAKLLAELHMADSESNLGNARCKVMLVRNGKLETVWEATLSNKATSDSIASTRTSSDRNQGNTGLGIPVEIDIADAQLVVLVVEKGEQGQLGDHVLWLDARIATQ